MGLSAKSSNEGFVVLRIIMILSTISPLFALLAIRGISNSSDWYFEVACMLLAIVPTCFLWLRIRSAKTNEGKSKRLIGKTDNDSYHIIIYLFAMLLPFYRQDLDAVRELVATIAALVLIVVLFWRFNLHYINLYFLIQGYRVFTVHPVEEAGPHSENVSWTLITRRSSLPIGDTLLVYRITNTMYLEES